MDEEEIDRIIRENEHLKTDVLHFEAFLNELIRHIKEGKNHYRKTIRKYINDKEVKDGQSIQGRHKGYHF